MSHKKGVSHGKLILLIVAYPTSYRRFAACTIRQPINHFPVFLSYFLQTPVDGRFHFGKLDCETLEQIVARLHQLPIQGTKGEYTLGTLGLHYLHLLCSTSV